MMEAEIPSWAVQDISDQSTSLQVGRWASLGMHCNGPRAWASSPELLALRDWSTLS